jgi:putative phosphoesterase
MALRIGVLSDTHLGRVTPELENIFAKYLADKDLILHVGDVVCAEVLDFLSRKPFHGVCGNMDPAEVKARLPQKQVIELESYRVGLIHGWGSPGGLEDRVRTEFSGVDVIVYGHSHRAGKETRDGILLFNPGSATGFSLAQRNSIGVLELEKNIKTQILLL